MPTYLSFDLGYKNLAWCVVEKEDNEDFRILEWRVDDIVEGFTKAKKPGIDKLTECMARHLQTMEPLTAGVTDVLIEIQPVGFHRRSNTAMKVLSHVIQAYYFQRGLKVKFVSPKLKLGLPGCPATKGLKAKERYALHKAFAIDKCRELVPEGWRERFEAWKKKDDAADCLLQCITQFK